MSEFGTALEVLRSTLAWERGAVERGFLPAIRRVQTPEEAERVIDEHLTLLREAISRQLASAGLPDASVLGRAADALAEASERIERKYATRVSEVVVADVVLAIETLRRLVVEVASRSNGSRTSPEEIASTTRLFGSVVGFLQMGVLAIALRVEAFEALADNEPLARRMARLAFSTAQTARGSFRELGLDLTPWLDLPPDRRTARLSQAAARLRKRVPADRWREMESAWRNRTWLPHRR